MKKDKKILVLSFVTAAITVAAGILHLQMVQGSLSHNLGEGILFLVGGMLQIFWAVPVVRQWGRVWQIIGIAGTIVFFILWYASRLHLIPEGDMLRGESSGSAPPREFPRSNMTGGSPRGHPLGLEIGGLLLPPIEILQIVFIGLYATLSKMISRR